MEIEVREATGSIYTQIAQAAYKQFILRQESEWKFRIEEGMVFARNGDGIYYWVDGVPAILALEEWAGL